MRIKLGKLYYNLKFSKLRGNAYGYCDPPDKKNKTIWIHNQMGSKKTLEIVIHELLHGLNWHIDEDHVTQAARDMANVLDKIGYKRDGNNKQERGKGKENS